MAFTTAIEAQKISIECKSRQEEESYKQDIAYAQKRIGEVAISGRRRLDLFKEKVVMNSEKQKFLWKRIARISEFLQSHGYEVDSKFSKHMVHNYTVGEITLTVSW